MMVRTMSGRAERLTRFGYIGLIWLVYLVYPLGDLVAGSHSLGQRIVGGLGLLLFLPLYLIGYRPDTRWHFLDIVAICALGSTLVVFVGQSFFGILVYAAAFAGLRPSWQRATTAIAGVALTHVVLGLAGHLNWGFVLIGVLMDLSIGINNLSYSRYFGARVELARAREEVERLAALAERGRIARDLHDVLGQTLTVITLKAQLAARLTRAQPERAVAEMTDVESVSRQALDQLRMVVGGYRSEGLQGELSRAQSALQAAGIRFGRVDIPAGIPPLTDGVLGLVLREGVTNVMRHSAANHCIITIEVCQDAVLLCMEDDGRGLDGADVGTGLASMRERLVALGGSLELASGESGRGARLRARVPLAGTASSRNQLTAAERG